MDIFTGEKHHPTNPTVNVTMRSSLLPLLTAPKAGFLAGSFRTSFSTCRRPWQGRQRARQTGRERLSPLHSFSAPFPKRDPTVGLCGLLVTQGCSQGPRDRCQRVRAKVLGRQRRRKAQACVGEVENSGKDQLRPSQERTLSRGKEAHRGGGHSGRGEEASRASVSSGWEGKGKLEGKGLSQEKTNCPGAGEPKGVERPKAWKKKELSQWIRFQCRREHPAVRPLRN